MSDPTDGPNPAAAFIEASLWHGTDVRAPGAAGCGYWDIARNRTALHIAAWRSWPATVKLLIERGAPVRGIAYPSDYTEVDELLCHHGAPQ
ncbi:MAG TPA: ankyrin repeat domain-containing protein [Gemmatimonadaceae bacterium]|nr:ankyrin repeat domain-containing protein [Gemmatimonadaceae bacterium]